MIFDENMKWVSRSFIGLLVLFVFVLIEPLATPVTRSSRIELQNGNKVSWSKSLMGKRYNGIFDAFKKPKGSRKSALKDTKSEEKQKFNSSTNWVNTTFNLKLIHLNDFHSHFLPMDQHYGDCDLDSPETKNCYGGVARIVAKVKEIRENNRENTLFLNAGDSFQQTVWYSLFKWRVVSYFAKYLKYDAMTIGNHEFDDGVDGYVPFLDQTNALIPTVCSNIDVSEEPKLRGKIKKSIIIEVNNRKIGIIGYLTPETTHLSTPGNNIKFMDEIQCLKEEVKKLEDQGVNIIIGLGHSGWDRDKVIAKSVPEIDVIVGGHTHTFLYSGSPPSSEKPVGKYPTVLKHSTHMNLVVQSFAFGKYLGLIDIDFDQNGNIVGYNGNPILLDHSVIEDPEVTEHIKIYQKKLQDQFEQVIGEVIAHPLDSELCRLKECNLGNLITDAIVEYRAIEYMKNQRRIVSPQAWTDAPVCVYNGGSINSFLDIGNITLEDLLEITPYANPMVILVMSGRAIIKMLEHNIKGHDIDFEYRNNRFLQMSGMKVEYKLARPPQQNQLVKVLIRCADCSVLKYSEVQIDKEYRVIVPQYLASGGDGYEMLSHLNAEKFKNENIDYKIVSDYIKRWKNVNYAPNDNRISFI